MRGAIPPFPQYVMTRFLAKHRDNFNFTYNHVYYIIRQLNAP
jgi:hypothetical protein